MKKYFLLIAELIAVAIIMYHTTYYFLWFSNLRVDGYALVMFILFIIISVFLYRGFRNTDVRTWINGVIVAWLLGSVYALGPSMLKLGRKYHEGLIMRCTDLTSLIGGSTVNGLVDRWGRTVIDNNDSDFYYINQNIILGLKFRPLGVGNQWEVDVHVYENFKLRCTTKCKVELNSDSPNTLYDYIEHKYGQPTWNYGLSTDESHSFRLDLEPWTITEIVSESSEY